MIKIAAIVLCVATAISASGIYGGSGYGYDAPKPYAFGYNQVGGGGASSRKEVSDGAGNVKGSYSLAVGDGRKRVVDYVADGYGFRANVRTNEPGTDNKNPADVNVVATPSYGGYAASYKSAAIAPGYGYGGYGYGGVGYGYGGLGSGYGGLGYGYGGYGNGLGLGLGSRGYGHGYGLGGGYGYSRSYNNNGRHY